MEDRECFAGTFDDFQTLEIGEETKEIFSKDTFSKKTFSKRLSNETSKGVPVRETFIETLNLRVLSVH